MADFLDEKQKEIEARLKELRPLVDEYERLQAAAAALAGVPATARASARAPRRGAAHGTPSARRRGESNGAGRRGRPKGSGTRGHEALAIVKASPGISIPEIAEKIGIKQNYLYRVLPGLEQDGLVRRQGRGWHPAEAAVSE